MCYTYWILLESADKQHLQPYEAFISLNKKAFHKGKAFKKWCLQESNQGHKDFQSFALPTELRHQFGNRVAKVEKKLNQQRYFEKIY